MTAAEIIEELRPLGLQSYKNVLLNHGVSEPFFGVKIEEMKKIQKRVKKDYRLALDLYDTGIYDAMYLAGLISDDAKMTPDDLRGWVHKTDCQPLIESTVAWVASESPHGFPLAIEWIEAPDEKTKTAGWATLNSLVSIKDDCDLDIEKLTSLLERVEATIHEQPNRVRKVMNSYVIALGCYVGPLADQAMKTAERIGVVKVDMGKTECKVPYAPDYILKVRQRGTLGKKRKTAKC
jgi:Predicted DNA alkylation repair enzyme